MICFRCGDTQNLLRDTAVDTGAVCVWCLQHPDGFNEDDEWGEDSATQALARGPR